MLFFYPGAADQYRKKWEITAISLISSTYRIIFNEKSPISPHACHFVIQPGSESVIKHCSPPCATLGSPSPYRQYEKSSDKIREERTYPRKSSVRMYVCVCVCMHVRTFNVHIYRVYPTLCTCRPNWNSHIFTISTRRRSTEALL